MHQEKEIKEVLTVRQQETYSNAPSFQDFRHPVT